MQGQLCFSCSARICPCKTCLAPKTRAKIAFRKRDQTRTKLIMCRTKPADVPKSFNLQVIRKSCVSKKTSLCLFERWALRFQGWICSAGDARRWWVFYSAPRSGDKPPVRYISHLGRVPENHRLKSVAVGVPVGGHMFSRSREGYLPPKTIKNCYHLGMVQHCSKTVRVHAATESQGRTFEEFLENVHAALNQRRICKMYIHSHVRAHWCK